MRLVRFLVAALQEEEGARAAAQQHDRNDDEQQLLALGCAFRALFALTAFAFRNFFFVGHDILDSRWTRVTGLDVQPPCHRFPVTGITKSRGKRRNSGASGWVPARLRVDIEQRSADRLRGRHFGCLRPQRRRQRDRTTSRGGSDRPTDATRWRSRAAGPGQPAIHVTAAATLRAPRGFPGSPRRNARWPRHRCTLIWISSGPRSTGTSLSDAVDSPSRAIITSRCASASAQRASWTGVDSRGVRRGRDIVRTLRDEIAERAHPAVRRRLVLLGGFGLAPSGPRRTRVAGFCATAIASSSRLRDRARIRGRRTRRRHIDRHELLRHQRLAHERSRHRGARLASAHRRPATARHRAALLEPACGANTLGGNISSSHSAMIVFIRLGQFVARRADLRDRLRLRPRASRPARSRAAASRRHRES